MRRPEESARAGSRDRRLIAGAALGLLIVLAIAGSAPAQFDGMRFGPMGPGDLRKSEQQREVVANLCRRHLGTPLEGESLSDLRLLQRLIDERVIAPEQVYELQALGVVLGDVMAATLGLHWVAVDDEFGHSRALRWRQSDRVFFPVTMISKRVEAGLEVDVKGLYEKTRRAVEKLRRRSDY